MYYHRREALRTWQNLQALDGTYRNLLAVFVGAKHSKCAQALCEVLRKRIKNSKLIVVFYESTSMNFNLSANGDQDCPNPPKRPRLDSYSTPAEYAPSLQSVASSSGSCYGDYISRDFPHPRHGSDSSSGPNQGPVPTSGEPNIIASAYGKGTL